jgi:hypothetical protein
MMDDVCMPARHVCYIHIDDFIKQNFELGPRVELKIRSSVVSPAGGIKGTKPPFICVGCGG